MSLAAILNSKNPNQGQQNLVECYAVGTDGWPYYIRETAPGDWSNSTWFYLGQTGTIGQVQPKITSRLTAAMNANGCVEVFGVGPNSNVYHIVQPTPGTWLDANGTFANWGNLGETSISTPTVGVNADGTLTVFIVGTNCGCNLLKQSAPGSWTDSEWDSTSLGGQNQSEIGVGVLDSCLNVFARGDNSALYQASQTAASSSTWNGWNRFTSMYLYIGNHAVVVDANSDIALFQLNEQLQLNYWNSSSGEWANWGGTSISDPVAALINGVVQVFVLGDNSSLYTYSVTTGDTSTNLTGTWMSDPAVVANATGNAEVFILGDDCTVYTLAQTNNAWPSEPDWTPLTATSLLPAESGLRIRGRSMGLL